MKILNQKSILNFIVFATAATFMILNAEAANQIGQTIKEVTGALKDTTTLVIAAFFVAGLFAVGSGGWDLYKQNQQGQQKPEMKGVFFKLIGGGVMVAITSIALYMKTNLVGSGNEELKIESVNFGDKTN